MTALGIDDAAAARAGQSAGSASRIEIGPFDVGADAAEAAAFRLATHVAADADDGELPFTFPVRWLVRPEIRAVVLGCLAAEDGSSLLPLHESQSFDYVAGLRAGVTYRMRVVLRHERDAGQIVLNAEIGPSAADVHLRMEMVLRLVAAAEAVRQDGGRPGA